MRVCLASKGLSDSICVFSFVIFWVLQAQPLLKDRRKFTLMADPLLEGNYPIKGLYQALAVAAMCLQEEATIRPLMSDVVMALEYLSDKRAAGVDGDEEDEDTNKNEDEGEEEEEIKDTTSSDRNRSGGIETDHDEDNGESNGKTTKKEDNIQ